MKKIYSLSLATLLAFSSLSAYAETGCDTVGAAFCSDITELSGAHLVSAKIGQFEDVICVDNTTSIFFFADQIGNGANQLKPGKQILTLSACRDADHCDSENLVSVPLAVNNNRTVNPSTVPASLKDYPKGYASCNVMSVSAMSAEEYGGKKRLFSASKGR